jgi:hypothetical protein
LPGSRQSQVLFNNLVESYAPKAGEDPQTRATKRAARRELALRLRALANGQDVTISDLPGFEGLEGMAPAGPAATARPTPAQRVPSYVTKYFTP